MAEKKFIAEAVQGAAAQSPPETFCRQIGLIASRWAYIEHTVQAMLWQASGVSKEVGRIVVREPRVSSRLTMLADVIGLRKAAWDEKLFKQIVIECEAINQRRDLMVHGLWCRNVRPLVDEWVVQRTRGAYSKDPGHPLSGVKRAVVPQGGPVALADLGAIVTRIDAVTKQLKELRRSAHMP